MQTEQDTVKPTEKVKQPFSMSQKGQELAEQCVTRKSLLTSLSENQCFSDAIMLLSYAMPHEKGINWGIGCVRANGNKKNNSTAISAVESWVKNPCEKTRAEILPTNTVYQPSAATWLAMAIYWAGGCITDSPIVESTPVDLVNDSIYSSVMLSVQETEEEKREAAYSEAIDRGINLLYA